MKQTVKVNKIPHTLKKCEAKTRPLGIPCSNWGMPNGRCRMHGGKSTGPRTAEGRERIRQANWKHGGRSAQAREEHQQVRRLLCSAKKLSTEIQERSLEGSLTPNQVNPMLEELRAIESKLICSGTKLQYPSLTDLIALSNYIQKKIDQVLEALNGKR